MVDVGLEPAELAFSVPELPANRWHRIRREMLGSAVLDDGIATATWLPDPAGAPVTVNQDRAEARSMSSR